MNTYTTTFSWIASLQQELPLFLVKLLSQREGESLERLQLVDVEIKLVQSPLVQEVSLQRFSESGNNFLELRGGIKGSTPLDVRIRYFVRGQRKFFKPSITQEECVMTPWRAMDRQWVINSLSEYKQENSSLTSPELAQLNGRTDIHVPNHLVLGAILREALMVWPPERVALSHFMVKFLSGININDKLEKASLIDEASLTLKIDQNGSLVLLLKAE